MERYAQSGARWLRANGHVWLAAWFLVFTINILVVGLMRGFDLDGLFGSALVGVVAATLWMLVPARRRRRADRLGAAVVRALRPRWVRQALGLVLGPAVVAAVILLVPDRSASILILFAFVLLLYVLSTFERDWFGP